LRQKQMQTASRYFPTEDLSCCLNWLSMEESDKRSQFIFSALELFCPKFWLECLCSKFWAYLTVSAFRWCAPYRNCMLLVLVSVLSNLNFFIYTKQ
jgi:hypothetical protein